MFRRHSTSGSPMYTPTPQVRLAQPCPPLETLQKAAETRKLDQISPKQRHLCHFQTCFIDLVLFGLYCGGCCKISGPRVAGKNRLSSQCFFYQAVKPPRGVNVAFGTLYTLIMTSTTRAMLLSLGMGLSCGSKDPTN